MPGRSHTSGAGNDIYKFSGKELDDENGLGLYYFGARYYDPVIGRFLSVDPLSRKYLSQTPYHYVFNNPLIFVDPSGMSVEEINSGEAGSYIETNDASQIKGGDYVFIGNGAGNITHVMVAIDNPNNGQITLSSASSSAKRVKKSQFSTNEGKYLNNNMAGIGRVNRRDVVDAGYSIIAFPKKPSNIKPILSK